MERPQTNSIKYDRSILASEKDVQRNHQASVSELISSNLNKSDEPNKQLTTIEEYISKSALQEVGIIKRSTRRAHPNDIQEVSLVTERDKLRLILNNNKLCEDRKV